MKVLITGDTFLGSEKLQKAAEKGLTESIFGAYLSYIRDCDLAITNLESPIVDDGDPIAKIGPSLSASKKSLPILKKAGFGLVTLANNHVMDYGYDGIVSTLEACEKVGLDYVGAGENLYAAKKTFYYVQDELKIGIVNLAENEFGTTTGDFPGAHPMDIVENFNTIREAKKEADKVIVIVHGGHELYPYPSIRLKNQYRFFIDAGADAVIGHHPHWCSGYEVYKHAPIFYSLGNFLFEHKRKENDRWFLGYGVMLNITTTGIDFDILPYKQNSDGLGIKLLTGQDESDFQDYLYTLNVRLEDNAFLEKEFDRLCNEKARLYAYYIEPHASQIIRVLQRLKILPSLWSKSKRRLLLNLIRCESHRDILLKQLTNKNIQT